MPPKVMSLPLTPNFHASHWKNRPACQSNWHALETEFGQGHSFLETVKAWQTSPDRPTLLFFTAFSSDTPTELCAELAEVCFGLLPGVHRFLFQGGQVQLNLCIGAAPSIAKEIDIAADSLYTGHLANWHAKTLARLCQVGSHIKWHDAHESHLHELSLAGFQLNASSSTARYSPPWHVKSSLRKRGPVLSTSKLHNSLDAIVVGAGLAGSSVAHSLATRGWQVKVLDKGHSLGAGASGLPAGLFATHVSPDNNVLSRITRDGVRATMQRAQELLVAGRQWQLSHLLEYQYTGKRQLPDGALWPDSGHTWSTQANTHQKLLAGLFENSPALWHNTAGWLQPQDLVKAQLQHASIHLQTNSSVARLLQQHNQWQCLDAEGLLIAQAPRVILANAYHAQSLIDSVELTSPAPSRPHMPSTALRGQVTMGTMKNLSPLLQQQLPLFPVNGHGSYIGHLQSENSDEAYWIVGSSFQRNDLDVATREADQVSNLQQWAELMPAWQEDILKQTDLSQTTSWAAIRMALPDRLPAVGAFLHPQFKGVHVCTGMGARGISWSVLCGELLAAHLNHEPLPMAASLARLMAASRFG